MGMPAGGGAALEVDDAAVKVLASPFWNQGLPGAAYFAPGPTGNWGSGVDGYVFHLGYSDYSHTYLLRVSLIKNTWRA
jgi:hypothetical protein